jgi:hypothetical protein
VIHGLDITVPLGLALMVPEERLRRVLPASVNDKTVMFFGADRARIEFRASDMDWTLGCGQVADRRRSGSAARDVRRQAPGGQALRRGSRPLYRVTASIALDGPQPAEEHCGHKRRNPASPHG